MPTSVAGRGAGLDGEYHLCYSYMMRVGARIRRLRKARGLTTPALALRASVSRMHMYRIERDDISPTLDTLARVAKALGVKVRDLIG